jgi:hypothetical protein
MKSIKHNPRQALIPFLFVITLMMFLYVVSLSIGGISFFISVMSKVAGFIAVKALSFILKKVGCSSALASVIGCAFRALVTAEASPSLAHCMLPGPSSQVHVPEDYVPDRYAVAVRSAPPEGLEIKKPLMEDNQRYAELESRLTPHFLNQQEQETRILFDDLVEKQLLIEKEIEKRLLNKIRELNDEFSGEEILANRHAMRECLFYKGGAPLKERTLDTHLKELQSNPYGSVPYRRIQKRFQNIFF